MKRIQDHQRSAIRGLAVILGISTRKLILQSIDRDIPEEFLTYRQAVKVMDWSRIHMWTKPK